MSSGNHIDFVVDIIVSQAAIERTNALVAQGVRYRGPCGLPWTKAGPFLQFLFIPSGESSASDRRFEPRLHEGEAGELEQRPASATCMYTASV